MVLRSYLCRNLQYFSCSGSCGLNIGSSLGWLILQGFSLSPESLAWILCAVFLKAFPELLACWLPLQTWNTGRVCSWRVGVYRACRIEDVLFSCCMTHNIPISWLCNKDLSYAPEFGLTDLMFQAKKPVFMHPTNSSVFYWWDTVLCWNAVFFLQTLLIPNQKLLI